MKEFHQLQQQIVTLQECIPVHHSGLPLNLNDASFFRCCTYYM